MQVVRLTGETDAELLRNVMPLLRNRCTDSRFALLGATHCGGKPMISVFLSQSLVDEGKHAGQMIKSAAKHIQGGGGGQPWMATAGGRDVNGLDAAMNELLDALK